jgi:fused signal recognition particle receptor
MAAAGDPTRSAAAAVRASRRVVPIGAAGCALVTGVLLLGNPFAANPPRPSAPQPVVHAGITEPSLSESTPTPSLPAVRTPAPPPAPVATEAATAPAFVVPPAPAAANTATPSPVIPASTPAPPRPAIKQTGGGKRAPIIVEALPATPIIPPFVAKQPAGATPEPHPPLPLDTEIETKGAAGFIPAALPASKTAAAGPPRNG